MAEDTPLWLDGLKFAPGYLAFLITVTVGIRKWWSRRNLLAIGPREDVRAALRLASLKFEDVRLRKPDAGWFQETEQRELRLALQDLSERVADKVLRSELSQAAEMWRAVTLNAGELEFFSSYDEATSRVIQMQKQAHAALGAKHTAMALARLNELEPKVVGRP